MDRAKPEVHQITSKSFVRCYNTCNLTAEKKIGEKKKKKWHCCNTLSLKIIWREKSTDAQ